MITKIDLAILFQQETGCGKEKNMRAYLDWVEYKHLELLNQIQAEEKELIEWVNGEIDEQLIEIYGERLINVNFEELPEDFDLEGFKATWYEKM